MPSKNNQNKQRLEQLLGKIENLDLQITNRSKLYAKSNISINEDSIKSELQDIYNNLQSFFTDLSNTELTNETMAIVDTLVGVDKLIEDVGYQQDTVINLVTNDIENTVQAIRNQIKQLITG